MSPSGERRPAAKNGKTKAVDKPAARQSAAAQRAAKRAQRRERAAKRSGRRSMSLVLALIVAVAALAAGVLVGYAARGEPPAAGTVTVERDVRVVTVTVTVPSAP